MTEQQIRDGFDRLEGALAPPVDTLGRVDRRVRVRRRRRRTAVVVTAGLGVAAVGATVALGLGGDTGSGPQVAVDPPQAGLVMERPDGSTYAFVDVVVTCHNPDPESATPDNGPERVWAYSPIEPSATDDDLLATPFFYAEGIVADLQDDRSFDLPIDGPGGSDSYPLTLFVADTEGGTTRDPGNEAASSAGGSGTVRVLAAACDPEPVLKLEVDGVLASEEGKDDLGVTGSLR